ncbi:unnamed protein product [Rotaria magnacalcarata]|uniref:protein-tyrosine-phosphatase n=1 Tax=Rotaria magnacalcarata TaxID=392030 RepID=A0A819D6W5_9BILA|nr:unnamed protein product [Rotaria magnacalcarata]CAF1658098.1 unnamed protein product [Rotaria magnacalcarata]CAF1980334.1 unnamed protein product [Rotaria magnacalcarata]CAF2053677.1 unnamed protein product [Rotaria magnacalcarata]CAF2154730.1 unnamed protein product [Rotaria magnacalcarata]
MFHSSVRVMGQYLKETFNATDEELLYLQELLNLREQKLKSLNNPRHIYGCPSVVIDDFLYHGDLGHASNIKLLNELGIRHIVDICDCELDQEVLDKFHVLWVNINDELRVDIRKYFEETNQFLHECKEKNEKVLVHCQMGISRSSSVVLAYLMKYHHDSLLKAYDYLIEKRRVAAPNLSFFLQLIRYEKELRATKEIDESKHNDDQQNPIEKLDSNQDPVASNAETEDGPPIEKSN